jgi:hypothetical protein
MVTIDLVDTPLRDAKMETLQADRSPKDWLICEVAHQKFRGQGDPQKLAEILRVFETWAINNTK